VKLINDEQKQELIQLHNEQTFTRGELASRFNISYAYVCKLIRDSKDAGQALAIESPTSVTLSRGFDVALRGTLDDQQLHTAIATKVESVSQQYGALGSLLKDELLPLLEEAKHRYAQPGRRTALAGCPSYEEYLESIGLNPATVRQWRHRLNEKKLLQLRGNGRQPPSRTRPLHLSRKQKDRLLNAASIIGTELLPAFKVGADISGPIKELEKLAFDSKELTSVLEQSTPYSVPNDPKPAEPELTCSLDSDILNETHALCKAVIHGEHSKSEMIHAAGHLLGLLATAGHPVGEEYELLLEQCGADS
jgi:transposase